VPGCKKSMLGWRLLNKPEAVLAGKIEPNKNSPRVWKKWGKKKTTEKKTSDKAKKTKNPAKQNQFQILIGENNWGGVKKRTGGGKKVLLEDWVSGKPGILKR